jgi:hypothetical protein
MMSSASKFTTTGRAYAKITARAPANVPGVTQLVRASKQIASPPLTDHHRLSRVRRPAR